MNLDVNTLFMVTMHVEVMLGLLLFFAWAQNFGKKALAWWGCAHLLRALSIMLLGMHGVLPGWASLDLANAVLFSSFAVTWSGARVFDNRSPEPIWGMVGVMIWVLACRLPHFADAVELRALLGSAIVTAYTWLAAYEFWRGRSEPLISRWPAIFMLFAHGSLFLLRTPLGAMMHLTPGSDFALSGWLELLSVEALLFTISIAFILLAMAKERTELRHRLASQTDALTGIANRRGFLEVSAAQRRARIDGRPIAVMLIDLDHFKTINDALGHARGDGVLQTFARTTQTVIGTGGLAARWGGDEFAILLYDTSREQAADLAERLRDAFEATTAADETLPSASTVSIGVVFCPPGTPDLSGLLIEADRALYRAKEAGRNRIELVDAEPSRAPRPKGALDLARMLPSPRTAA